MPLVLPVLKAQKDYSQADEDKFRRQVENLLWDVLVAIDGSITLSGVKASLSARKFSMTLPNHGITTI